MSHVLEAFSLVFSTLKKSCSLSLLSWVIFISYFLHLCAVLTDFLEGFSTWIAFFWSTGTGHGALSESLVEEAESKLFHVLFV